MAFDYYNFFMHEDSEMYFWLVVLSFTDIIVKNSYYFFIILKFGSRV